jgi:hypothetical protein
MKIGYTGIINDFYNPKELIMKSHFATWTIYFMVIVLLVSSCAPTAAPAPAEPAAPEATADIEATVNAALEATAAAQAGMQATIDASVSSTVEAQPADEASDEAGSAETADPAEYVTMTEEELALLIEDTVEEANTASQEMSTAAEQAASDGEVSQDEINEVYNYYYDAEAALMLAEEMIDAYMYFYGDLAYAYLDLFYLVEEDLSELAAYAAEINEILILVEQGITLSADDIDQMITAAANIQSYLVENQVNVANLSSTVQQQIQDRAAAALGAQANQVPGNIRETLQAGFQYADFVYSALGDNQITLDELNTIAQLGANAASGFSQFGGDNQSQLADLISGAEGITANLAQGQNMQAWDSVEQLELGLGERPAGISRPERPERPSRP